MGDVSARIFVHPDQKVSEVNSFIRVDILRSITGRFRVYQKAFPDNKGLTKSMAIRQVLPPRRFYIKPFVRSIVHLCDFEFEGIGVKSIVNNGRLLFGMYLEKNQIQMFSDISKC